MLRLYRRDYQAGLSSNSSGKAEVMAANIFDLKI
jgi:hypothetical protein